jgi:formylglycine-generating enzyme required for sulfatase activity
MNIQLRVLLLVLLAHLADIWGAYAQPTVLIQPLSTSGTVGSTVEFSVPAVGSGTLVYQWRRSGTNMTDGMVAGGATLSGAASATLTLIGITASDSAAYSCRITDNSGSVTSSVAALTIIVPPYIIVHPSSCSTNAGADVTFRVMAGGTAPLTYQWYMDGVLIPGVTLNSYTIGGVFLGDAGTYKVRVLNSAGSATSSNLVLNVGIAPTIENQPASLIVTQGQSATFSLTATGTPLGYRWKKDGIPVAGGTNRILTIDMTVPASAGNYLCEVSNFVGMVVSDHATLAVCYPPAITAEPVGMIIGEGSNFTLRVTAAGFPPPAFQWYKDGVAIAGASADSVTINRLLVGDSGTYQVRVTNILGTVVSSNAVINVGIAPAIESQPASLMVTQGQSATFSITATGTSLGYRWKKDGVPVLGGTNRILTIAMTSPVDAGTYLCEVGNFVGVVASDNATLVFCYPPTITDEPVSVVVGEGTNFALWVTAAGFPPPAIQWYKDGTLLPGAEGPSNAVAAACLEDAGTYYVVAANSQGTATSRPVTVVVGSAPVVTQPPVSVACLVGGAASFRCLLEGTQPMSLQWTFFGTPLPGQKNTTLNLANVQPRHFGAYALTASNAFGSTISSNANLQPEGYLPTLWDDLVAWYPLDGGAKDLRGGHHGIAVDTAGVADRFGTANAALLFNGQSAHVRVPASPDFDFSEEGQFSLLAWFKIQGAGSGDSGQGALVAKSPASGTWDYGLMEGGTNQHRLWSGLDNRRPCEAPNVLPSGAWHQAAVTYNDGAWALYLDGQPVAATNTPYRITRSAGGLAFGRRGDAGSDYFNGAMDDVRIYRRSLNPAEVGQLYALEADVPVFIQHPQSQAVISGDLISLSTAVSAAHPLCYQWYFNGAPIPGAGATSPTLWLANVQPAQAGYYSVTVSNDYAASTSFSARLAVLVKPFIIAQPVGNSIGLGAFHAFTVLADGTAPLGYQWYKDGVAIPGANAYTYAIIRLSAGDSGTYCVQVTNAAGTVVSSNAVLNVWSAPAIASQPEDGSVTVGQSAAFSLVATGTSLRYYWMRNGQFITGQTNSSLIITNVALGDAANYACLVSNAIGQVTSSVARLTVLLHPRLQIAAAGSKTVLAWLTNGVAYTALTSSNFSATAAWRPVTNAAVLVGLKMRLTNQPASNPAFYRLFPTPTNMVFIPSESFTMGDSLDGNSSALPLHTVIVSAFYMDKYEVTKALWDGVCNWATNNGYGFDYSDSGQGKAANHPAHTMTWYDSVKWCNARSQKEGRLPAYYTDAAMTVVYKRGQVEPYVRWDRGYRLPTEAEWEMAARGGASGRRFPWGDTITHSQANYYSSSAYAYDISPTRVWHPTYNDGVSPYTSPVGSFAANAYGLYDMAGNVVEWCWDFYGNYGSATKLDPRGAAASSYRVYRGGGWGSYAIYSRVTNRNSTYPNQRNSNIGFRSALPPGQP